jgi:type III pantothenate kinase
MILCIDVGNTSLHGGVYKDGQLIVQFRKTSRQQFSSDEFGIFLRSVLRENDIDYRDIKEISLCSVVPDMIHSIRSGIVKYFKIEPFILRAGVKTGLKIKYRNPLEVGADRIANAIAGTSFFPDQNLIIVDFGTATTFCIVSGQKEYLGGIILSGIRISMESLVRETALLPKVEIREVSQVIGKSTAESIQSGLYFGQIGIIKEIVAKATSEAFDGPPLVIGTGGFSSLFESTGLFHYIIPTLVLDGLFIVLQLNKT